jgi:hypothetical protein
MSDLVVSVISNMVKLMVNSISSLMGNLDVLKTLMLTEEKQKTWFQRTFGGKSSLSKFNE